MRAVRAPLRLAAVAGLAAIVAAGCGGDDDTAIQSGGERFEPPPPTATNVPTTATTAPVEGPVVPIRPTSIVASATAPPGIDASGNRTTYDAAFAIDGNPTTAWRTPGDGRGVTLTLQLPPGTVVAEVGLLPGFAKVDSADGTDRFAQNRRVVAARYRLSGGAGEHAFDARFTDERRVQFIDVARTPAATLVIEIVETTAAPARDFTPISEIEVRGASASS